MGRVLSASVEVSNSGDAARQYGITAHVDIQEGKVTNVHQGVVTDIETTAIWRISTRGAARSGLR